jgi:tetratricopeptide (TPR) repeat protein/predicted Ser/Thr protein kinase
MLNPGVPDSNWYQKEGALVHGLQRMRRAQAQPPVIEGYDGLLELQRGGQGVVYTATQQSTNRRVAIKLVSADILHDRPSIRRFEREIELVAGLQHPGIVRVYDSGLTADNRRFLAMEFIDGIQLDQYLQSMNGEGESRINSDQLLRLFVKICDAVSYAHQNGIMHRDLKPGNILIDDRGEPHILDFGIAALETPPSTASMLTRTDSFLGTLAYAAPEQVQRQPRRVDTRADVYALGLLLYEMLTRRHPYPTSRPLAEVIQAITETVPEKPTAVIRRMRRNGHQVSHFAADVNDEIDAIVLKALAKDPQRRYQSTAAMLCDVERYLAGQAIEAKLNSPFYVLRKLVQRHKLASALALTLLLTLISFGAATSMAYQRAQAEGEKAQQIRTFLEDTLASVDPAVPGREVTVREVLDEAINWVAITLTDQPEIEASLRVTIGNSYRAMGEYDAAEEQAGIALAVHRDLFGNDDPSVTQSLNLLALIHLDRRQYDQAEELFRESLAIRRRLLGEDHPLVAQSLMNMASLLQSAGRFDEAEAALHQTLEIRRQCLGDEHPDVAMCHFRLGVLSEAQGDLAAAEQRHEAALAIRRLALNPEHPDLERSLLALGKLLSRTGKPEQGEPLLRECLELRTERLPEDHWRIAEATMALGNCLISLRRYDEAEPYLTTAYENIAQHPGAQHRQLAEAVENVVQLYDDWGKPEQAEAYRALLPP